MKYQQLGTSGLFVPDLALEASEDKICSTSLNEVEYIIHSYLNAG